MNEIKLQLIMEINQFLIELKDKSPISESLEWYLINNLESYLKGVNEANTSGDVENLSDILDRFCVESMDWDTEIFRRCTRLTKLGIKLSKSM